MVFHESLGFFSSNYLAGGIGGVIVVIIIVWFLSRRKSGRIGEERQEERETDQLREDEVEAVQDQVEEKRQCHILDGLFTEIITILHRSGVAVSEEIIEFRRRISSLIVSLEKEQEGVEQTLETFRELHSSITMFARILPMGNTEVDAILNKIGEYQKDYYKVLMDEIKMDKDKKERLRKLWTDEMNEEKGHALAA